MPGIGMTAFALGAFLGLFTYLVLRSIVSQKALYLFKKFGLIRATSVFFFVIIYISIFAYFMYIIILLSKSELSLPFQALYSIRIYASIPIVTNSFLGVFWGALSGIWINYLLRPKALRIRSISVAHRRGGIALIFLALLPILAEFLPSLISRLQTVQGPGFSLTLIEEAQPQSSTQFTYAGAAKGELLQHQDFLTFLKLIAFHVARDEKYIRVIADEQVDHSSIAPAFDKFFIPLADCLIAYNKNLPDASYLHRKISDFTYSLSVWNPDRAKSSLGGIDPSVEIHNKAPDECSGLVDLFEEHKKSIFAASENKPYGAMTIAFLSGSTKAYETAADELAKWLDRSESDDQINVSAWYKIRAQIYLEHILSILPNPNTYARERILELNLDEYNNMFSSTSSLWGGSVKKWCTALHENNKIPWYASSIMFSYVGQTITYIETALELTSIDPEKRVGLADEKYAEAAASLDASCIRAVLSGPDHTTGGNVAPGVQGEVLFLRARFLTDYAEVLVRIADQDWKGLGRLMDEMHEKYRVARNALLQASPILTHAERLLNSQASKNSILSDRYQTALHLPDRVTALRKRINRTQQYVRQRIAR